MVLDTDYDNWAVLSQCKSTGGDSPALLSTRVLSRGRDLGAAGWLRAGAAAAEAAAGAAGAAAPFRYAVDHGDCDDE